MKTALDLNPSELDEHEKRFVENIREHGWFGTHVAEGENEPRFSYTTGFWLGLQMPELVIFSLPTELSHQIFWSFYNDLSSGRKYTIGAPIAEMIEGYPVILKPVLKDHYPDHFGWSRWFYRGDKFEVNQIVFPDKSGQFPWDDGASDGFKATQPHLWLTNEPG